MITVHCQTALVLNLVEIRRLTRDTEKRRMSRVRMELRRHDRDVTPTLARRCFFLRFDAVERSFARRFGVTVSCPFKQSRSQEPEEPVKKIGFFRRSLLPLLRRRHRCRWRGCDVVRVGKRVVCGGGERGGEDVVIIVAAASCEGGSLWVDGFAHALMSLMRVVRQ